MREERKRSKGKPNRALIHLHQIPKIIDLQGKQNPEKKTEERLPEMILTPVVTRRTTGGEDTRNQEQEEGIPLIWTKLID